MTEKFFEKRWIIGGIFLLFCVVFEIHGSSISIYADIFGHPELSDVIFGKYRPIRSDEWIVFTPFAFSQYFNNFSLISEIVRAAPTNMFMTYGQAVWHPAIIFRPAEIGFLFLDQGSGLAFFWMSRLIILFLVSFEFASFILQVDKKYAVIYAIMIAFSPLAQWWWAVNSIAEILAAGQGVVVCWKMYLENIEVNKRFAYLAGFLFCAGVYIFGIYPAWQVPFGYVFLFCLIAISFQQKNALKSLWQDKIFWIAGFVIMLAPIAHAFYISRDMIELQMATEYPSRRFTTGGGASLPIFFEFLFRYGSDILLPFASMQNAPDNECEVASFFTMTPLGFIMFFYLRFKLKQNDFLMTLLFVVTVLFFIWEFTNIPGWLSKFSFMSMTTANRVRSAIDFAQLLMLFRGLSLIKNSPEPFARLILAEFIAALSAVAIYHSAPEWLIFKRGFIVFAFISLSVFLFLTPLNKKSFFTLSLLMLIMGITVNPINAGVDSVYKQPVGQKISEIVQNEVALGNKKSLWIVEDDGIVLNDFPIMFGAPTINSVNVYPYFERWNKLDPAGENFKIYNRYAHIMITLTNEKTKFYFGGADNFKLFLNPDDLSALKANYILSRNGELENFSTSHIKIQKIYEDAGSFIYSVKEIA